MLTNFSADPNVFGAYKPRSARCGFKRKALCPERRHAVGGHGDYAVFKAQCAAIIRRKQRIIWVKRTRVQRGLHDHSSLFTPHYGTGSAKNITNRVEYEKLS